MCLGTLVGETPLIQALENMNFSQYSIVFMAIRTPKGTNKIF